MELGKDGVGDYTRLLAEACVRQGHECYLVSINERLLTQISKSKIAVDFVEMSLLRLPTNMPWKQRIAHAEKLLALFQPDWISLQFVPYGYQDKGIIIKLRQRLQPLLKERRLHIMFHELWIGQNTSAKLRERLVGTVQKFFILQLIKQLKPLVVHTSNSTYIALLKRNGVSASRLPLFGSISITNQNAERWLFSELQELGLNIKTEPRNHFWLFGFFGSLHPVWPAEPLFSCLYGAAIKNNRQVAIISIGRLGPGEELWQSLSKNYSSQFVFLRLGERSPLEISEFFNSIDFGIATSPYALIGKSATVAAMLEHKLPVIVNRDDFKLASCTASFQEPQSLLYKIDQIDDYLANKLNGSIRRKLPQSGLPDVTTQFIKDITLASIFYSKSS
ncbi:hypothetical protein [Chlorogloea sp. CCALA 695]|uniref:hypothetical protein n=1 Tax=Chlorogloea sp. CCALA 695 TaxID=2107693 RepID=UPI0011B227C3|nr:hypothetical protein [Chlorogloea sp. CCALA 695]